MKFLYYSTSYYANHGGSIQSIEFFKQLKLNSEISELEIFPVIPLGKKSSKNKSSIPLRKYLRRISILQILFFYRRNTFHYKKLVKKIKDFKPDVVLIQIDSNFLQINRLKKRFPSLIICNQINGSPFDEPFKNIAFKKWFLKKQTEAYIKSNLNIFISEFSKNRIMGDAINNKRDVVIHNGTDPEKFYPITASEDLRRKWKFPSNKFIIGYIGTLDFHKQLGILIDVFGDLLTSFPDIYLVIIGDGPALSKLKLKVKDLGLDNHIELRGWIQHSEINENLNCFDLAIHHYASTYMNPLKIFEYLSAGLPVIAPNIPSVRSIFRDREDLLITGASHEDLRKSLLDLLTNEELRIKLSNNQHLIHEIEGNYTWKKYTDRIINCISERLNLHY